MQKKKTNEQISNLINLCKYRDWDISLRYDGSEYIKGRKESTQPYVQIQFDAPDSFTGVVERQYCRKWKLSYYMTDSEIVRTVYKAIEAAVLHEMQEEFKFMDEPIFRPHYDVYELHILSALGAVDRRE
jgi:hypothetical protein